jgi:hypothetical protein
MVCVGRPDDNIARQARERYSARVSAVTGMQWIAMEWRAYSLFYIPRVFLLGPLFVVVRYLHRKISGAIKAAFRGLGRGLRRLYLV